MIKIKEIFESVQGEGPYVGCNQVFIRFCGCNLCCAYCDTDFNSDKNSLEFTPPDLAEKVNEFKNIHSVSLTGGEPLLSVNFLKEFLPLINNKIYLETNATLVNEFVEIKDYVDIVSADIKLESATGLKNTFEMHDKFFEACKGKETFAKIVFNNKITNEEIKNCCELGKKYNLELILQPEMIDGKLSVDTDFILNIYYKFLVNYNRVRLIPQVHVFLGIR